MDSKSESSMQAKQMTREEIERIKAEGGEVLYDEDDPSIKKHTSSSGELRAALAEFRPIFDALRNEHPSWDTRQLRAYMYEWHDGFAAFHDRQPTAAELITKKDFPREVFEKLVSVMGLLEAGVIDKREGFLLLSKSMGQLGGP